MNIFSGPHGGHTRVPFRASHAQAGSTPLRNPGHVRTGSLLAMGPDAAAQALVPCVETAI